MQIRVYLNGQEILTILTRRRKTRTWLAQRAEIDPVDLSRMIRGKLTIGPRRADRILDAMRPCSYDDVFRMTMTAESVTV